MTSKNPFDMTEMFKFFDPDAMTRAFNPQAMLSMFQAPSPGIFDMEGVIRSNQRNFEAMKEANQAAAEAYKDLLDKQMEIFGKMTLAARQQYEWVEDTAGPDTLKAKTTAMSAAVEEALTLMKTLAEVTREANEQAYETVRGKVDEAVEGIKKG